MAAALIRRVSKEISLSSKMIKTQPWKRGFLTAIGETEASGSKVNVTSREMIKPSYPTPNDKKTVKFSLIDQLAVNCYMPFIFFYRNDPLNKKSIEKTSMLLKKSLSEILVDFYPLTGRIHRNELIDCSDQGVEFCEAQLSENLEKFIENDPSLDELQALMPFQGGTPRNKNIVLSIQVNHFGCGGTAIGVCLHHKIGDGQAISDFLRAWGTKAQENNVDDNQIKRPVFNGASLFPPVKELNEPIPPTKDQISLMSEERTAMRRLIFDKKAIDELKAQVTAAHNITRPTRVEVVNAFLFNNWPNKMLSIAQIVNLRNKMVQPVPEGFFGNCAWMTRTSSVTGNPGVFIQEFRKAIEKISGNYMNEFVSSDNCMLRLSNELGALFGRPEEFILCNSLAGAPLYEVNFGMDRPIWVCYADKITKNSILMTSTMCGQGIEVRVCMLEDDIAKLHHSLSQLNYPLVKPI